MKDALEQIKNLELDLLSANVRRDHARLAELIAEDFVEIGASGSVFNKDALLTHLPNEREITLKADHINCKPLSPTAILIIYRCIHTERDSQSYSRRSSIWSLRNGSWQILYHQGTKCEPPMLD